MLFPTTKLLITGIFVVLGGGFNFGFQVSIINPMGKTLQQFLAQSLESRYDIKFSELTIRLLWSFVVGIFFIGAIIGAAVVPAVINRIGSRWSFVNIGFLMIIVIFFSPLSQYTNIAELFILSRLFVGICVGMFTTVQGVFLTEISPVCFRGLMGTLTGLSTNIGALLASMIGMPQIFGTKNLWPYGYYMEMIPCLMLICYAIFILHESPLYFLKQMNESAAKESIQFYNNWKNDRQIDDETERLKIQQKNNEEDKEIKNIINWRKFWNNRATRRALFLSILLNCTVSFSGIMAMVFFGTALLGAIGFTSTTASLANCLAGLSGTIGILIQAITIDKIGRRFLLLGSLISLILINLGMMILVWIFGQYHYSWLGYCFLLLFALFLFFFSIGIGPVAWFIATELAEPYCRAQLQSLSISAQYVTCFLCPIIYLPLEELIGPFSFLIFIIPLTITTFFIYYYMPETRNRSPEEIHHLLESKR
uniref:MFS domain-containing protein n=1 Tax=Wuchereria bancrofti TaxID=6293 RepID=A0A1I8ER31_WUCBA